MNLTFLGAAREVGRSGVLLECDKNLLFDYGIKIHGEMTEYPKIPKQQVDALLLSHAHLDHSGYMPVLFEKHALPVYATYPTQALSEMLVEDSMRVQERKGFETPMYSKRSLKKCLRSFVPLIYARKHSITDKTGITMHDAGHIPGAGIIEVSSSGKKIVYTGDFKMEETHLHAGADCIEDVDVLIIESTYANREHPERKTIEAQLCAEVEETLEEGGIALLPSFAVGRSQELLQLFFEHNPDWRPFIDGMAVRATQLMMEYPSYFKNARLLKEAFRNAQVVSDKGKRFKALRQPGIIISPAGMLEGGHAVGYLQRLIGKNARIIFTGYSVQDTNGWMLLNKGMIHVHGGEIQVPNPVSYFDLSAHSGKSELFEFVKLANPQKVFCIHGDHCSGFAEELKEQGFDAVAPIAGEKFEI